MAFWTAETMADDSDVAMAEPMVLWLDIGMADLMVAWKVGE